MDREGPPRPPIDVVTLTPPPTLGFGAGVAVGVTIAAVAAQLWVAQQVEPMRHLLHESVELRNLTRLALSPTWRWGVPAVTLAIVAALLGLGVRRARWYAIVAAAAVLAVVVTYLWATAPLTELADAIRID